VDDNGPGIEPSLHDQILDPFFSTKTAVNGVGLGLYVAHGLLRAAEGRMTIASAPSGGARFVLDLPLGSAAKVEGTPVLQHAGDA
jgi:C4-dicarboxylate-specific signal transduction histidine kinase